VTLADVQIGHHGRADSVDRPDIYDRASVVGAISALCFEVDSQNLDLDTGRLNWSIRRDGAHGVEV